MSSEAQSTSVLNSDPSMAESQTEYAAGSNTVQPDSSSTPSQNPGAVGNSVVKDLLRVYESLTQSSTPQTSLEDVSGKPAAVGDGKYGVSSHISNQHVGHSQPAQGEYAQPGAASTMHNLPPPTYPPPQHQYFGEQVSYGQQGYSMPPGGREHSGQAYPVPSYEMPSHSTATGNDQVNEGQESDEEVLETNSGRTRRKRRASDASSSTAATNKGRKKSKASDGRWSKRFTWPEDLHRDFVSAIFDVGLKHSSPSTILEHMPKHEQITTERIKSHLQKYRMHRVKSKKEFVSQYEASLRNFNENGMDSVKSVSGGETAAQLSYMEVSGTELAAPKAAPIKTEVVEKRPQQSEVLMLPQLSEAEKSSPIGIALGHLLGLFLSLKQQLVAQRALEQKKRAEAQALAVAAASAQVDPNSDVAQAYKAAGALSGRTNIEENSMMKREMQSQMQLQNKMRALKQQELNKYKQLPPNVQPGAPVAHYEQSTPGTMEQMEEKVDNMAQGAGETAGSDGDDVTRVENRQRGLSLSNHDDFWNTDVVDDQLFEFLMNN